MAIKRKRVHETPRARKRPALGGSALITPAGVQARYGWSSPTRWRAERDGRLPPRDVFIGGKPAGWRPETIEAAERTPSTAAAPIAAQRAP